MKMLHWSAISGLLAAAAMVAPAEATTTNATTRYTGEDGMDVIVATARRPVDRPDPEGLAVSRAIDSAAADAMPAASPALGPGIGMRSRSDLFERVQEAARETIENVEITVDLSDERF